MKKLLTSLLAGVLLASVMPSAFANSFDDVDSSTSYLSSIEWMADQGVINGYGNGNFGPNDCVNRAEMLKMLFEMLELDETEVEYSGIFSDVPDEKWYTGYVLTAAARGTVEGYGDGTFKPTQCVLRSEAIKMTFEEFGVDKEVPNVGIGYADLDVDEWYFAYVFNAIGKSFVGMEHVGSLPNGGMASSLFYPNSPMDRKEVAEMLYRVKAATDNDKENYEQGDEPDPIQGQIFLEAVESGSSTNEFDVTEIELGDEIAGWEVLSVGKALPNAGELENNMSVGFSGEVVVQGEYYINEMAGSVGFHLQPKYASMLPTSHTDSSEDAWFIFENDEFARTELTNSVDETGTASIRISNYTYVRADAGVGSTAVLQEVITKIPDEGLDANEFDVTELDLSDSVMGWQVLSIGKALPNGGDLAENMEVQFDGETTLQGSFAYNPLTEDTYFYVDDKYSGLLPISPDDERDVYFTFDNSEIAKSALYEANGNADGRASVKVSNFVYVYSDASVWSSAVLVEVVNFLDAL